eukprot:PITA_03929
MKTCQFDKKTRSQFIEKEGSASKPLELVHTDLCGPSKKKSPQGEEYFILFIDYFSRIYLIGLLKHKDEEFEKFKAFKALVESESDRKIKCLQYDRGGEFTSNEFFDFCEQHGINRQFSIIRTPQQNGVVERMNIIVQQMAHAMLDESITPATLWGEDAFIVVTILNQENVWVNNTQTPHELWYDKNQDYDDEEDEDHFSTSNHTGSKEETNEAPEEEITIEEKTSSKYVQKNHPETQILGEKGACLQNGRTIVEASSYLALLSSTEPQNVNEACRDECWVKAMNEELEQI